MADQPKKTDGSDRLDLFERKFVFRTARGYFIFLACMAIFTFAIGAFLGARGIVRMEPDAPAEPILPPAPPAPKQLDLAAVEAWIQNQQNAPTAVEETAEPEWVSSARDSDDKGEDPAKKRFNELLEQVKSLFPEPQFSWNDTYTRTCARRSPYGCLRYEKQLDKEGVSKILQAAIRPELSGDSLTELNAVLEALVAVLKAAPQQKRAELIAPAAEAFRELQGGYRAQLRNHRREIADLTASYDAQRLEYEIELAQLKEDKESDLMSGLYGVLSGLGLLVLVSVFLAHFAIERHLRLVREALAGRS